ncbi:hypothetical protein CALCODRAFT_503226, partial [Calocera cornea HHB12733]
MATMLLRLFRTSSSTSDSPKEINFPRLPPLLFLLSLLVRRIYPTHTVRRYPPTSSLSIMFGPIGIFSVLLIVGSMAAPTRLARQTAQNGTIELVHDEARHSYTILATLDPTNYTNTFGMHELAYSADSDLYALLNFYVTSETPEDGNTTYYTIHSDVVSASDPLPIFPSLTNITIVNVAPQYFPDHELYIFSTDINGQPAMSGQYNSNTQVLEGYDFEASLTENLNVTGVVRAVSGDII